MPADELRDKFTPDYMIGRKRILISNDYYPTFRRDNVAPETSGIVEVSEPGIVTNDGEVELDGGFGDRALDVTARDADEACRMRRARRRTGPRRLHHRRARRPRAAVREDDAVRLRAAATDYGLRYPPDPASSAISTIGGNLATNAGGLCSVEYGVTTDAVIALTVVLADGSVTRVGRRTAKVPTGYQLAQLFAGSEGTLGIVVDATARLRPLSRREDRAIVGSFASLQAAGQAVAALTADGIMPAALELIDRTCLEAVAQWQELDLLIASGTAALLLVRVDEPGLLGRRVQGRVADHLARFAIGVETSVQSDDADRLFLARRLAYPSLERLGPVLTEDVCVPRRAVPEMLARIDAIALEHDVTIANIAQARDGNLHPLIIAP